MAVTHGGGATDQEPPDRSLVEISHFHEANKPRERNTKRSDDKSGTHQASGGKAKKVIDLNKQAEEDGNLDLNVAADTLCVTYWMQKLEEKSRYQWEELDHFRSKETYKSLKEEHETLSTPFNNAKPDEQNRFLCVTKEDITSLPGFQNSELIAVKAPHGTTLEEVKVNDRHLSEQAGSILGNTMGQIDHNLVSQPNSDANVPSTSAISEKTEHELYPNNEVHDFLADDFAKFASPEHYDVDLEWKRLGGGRLTYTEMLCSEDEPDGLLIKMTQLCSNNNNNNKLQTHSCIDKEGGFASLTQPFSY